MNNRGPTDAEREAMIAAGILEADGRTGRTIGVVGCWDCLPPGCNRALDALRAACYLPKGATREDILRHFRDVGKSWDDREVELKWLVAETRSLLADLVAFCEAWGAEEDGVPEPECFPHLKAPDAYLRAKHALKEGAP